MALGAKTLNGHSLSYAALTNDNIIYILFVSSTNNCLIIVKFSNLWEIAPWKTSNSTIGLRQRGGL